MSVAAFVLYEYSLGFYVQKGNPKNILSVSDLKRPDVALANREKGSTGRMYLDILLKDAKILPDQINGYQKELVSDFFYCKRSSDQPGRCCIGSRIRHIQVKIPGFYSSSAASYVSCNGNGIPEPARFSALVEIIRSSEFRTALRLPKRLQHLPNRRNLISVKRKRSPKGERFRFTHLYYSSVS